MIINKKIRKLLSNGLLIRNGSIDNIKVCSYDVTSSNMILKLKKQDSPISLVDASNITNMYEKVDISNGYVFNSGECILIALDEDFNVPLNMCGMIIGRTSFNRLGICVQTQFLNPGFCGKINLTVVNNSPNQFIITPNMHIAQVMFQKQKAVEKEEGYSKKDKYQNQDGLQGSCIYKDYVGKVVRHFKGNYYYIEDVCTDSETQEATIIYKNLYHREDSNVWARPAKMFFEEIDSKRKDNITKQKTRFQVVDDLSVDYTKKEK